MNEPTTDGNDSSLLYAVAAICLWVPLGLAVNANSAAAEPPVPQFNLSIKPVTMDRPVFSIEGSIAACSRDDEKVRFIIPQGADYKFTRAGAAVDVSSDGFDWKCDDNDSLKNKILFQGTSPVDLKKCEASHDEMFCLNNSIPNPEIISDQSLYQLNFELPPNYAALVPDSAIPLNSGIQFQIARFGAPTRQITKKLTVEYRFPPGFQPDARYPRFLESTLDSYVDLFGEPPFKTVKVGAIRRAENTTGGRLRLWRSATRLDTTA